MFRLFSLIASFGLLGVLYLWSTRTFPALGKRRRTVLIVLVSLLAAQFLGRFLVVHLKVGNVLQTVVIVTVMTLAIAAVPIAVMHMLAWLVERVARKLRPAPAPPEGTMTRRQVVEAVGGAAFLGATGSMLGWGMAVGRHAYELSELPVRIAALPRALDGYVIAQISDIHTGTYVTERELDEGFERVRAAKPDLVVVTGDLVDFDPGYIGLIARKLADLAPRDGVFACLGNHDDYTGADQVLAGLSAAGVHALVNEGKLIRAADGGGFALLGVDDLWAPRFGRGGPRLDFALRMVPEAAPRILLSHQPQTVAAFAGHVALQLSGHTHGGQINPGFRPAELFLPYVSGLYRVGGTALYVNRGFGTVGPPARIGAPPEVTRIVLVAA